MADRVDCGDGFDVATVDDRDRTTACEVVDRRPAVPRVEFTVSYEWAWTGAVTTPTRLALRDLRPPVAAVTVACVGAGCPSRLRHAVRTRHLDLLSLLRGRRLKPGATVEIRAAREGYITRVAHFDIRRGAAPILTIRCTSAGVTNGSRRLEPCPRSD